MIVKHKNTILFASLITTMMLSFSSMDAAFASDFKVKNEFGDIDEIKEYGKELGKELTQLYKEAKQSGDTTTLDKLKEHGVSLIHKYDPKASPLSIIEDEYFDMIESNDPRVQPVRYETVGKITNVVHIIGPVDARIGYDAPCTLIPIFVCEHQETSKKKVSTSDSGKSFIIWTDKNNDWLAPYTKLYTASGGNYNGYTAWYIPSWMPQTLTDYNFNGSQIYEYKKVGSAIGICNCNTIVEGSYINGLVVLQSIH